MEHLLFLRHYVVCCRYLVSKAESVLLGVYNPMEAANKQICISVCIYTQINLHVRVKYYVRKFIFKYLENHVVSVDGQTRKKILI